MSRLEPTRYHKIGHDGGGDRAAVRRAVLRGAPRRRQRSPWTSMPRTIRCTGTRRDGAFTAITTDCTCRCTSSAASTCSRRSCAGQQRASSAPWQEWSGLSRSSGGGLAGGAHPAAGRQRLLPRGDHGLVRGARHEIDYRSAWPRTAAWSRPWSQPWPTPRSATGAHRGGRPRVYGLRLPDADSWSRGEGRVVGKAESTCPRGPTHASS